LEHWAQTPVHHYGCPGVCQTGRSPHRPQFKTRVFAALPQIDFQGVQLGQVAKHRRPVLRTLGTQSRQRAGRPSSNLGHRHHREHWVEQFRFTLKKRARCCTAVDGESVPIATMLVKMAASGSRVRLPTTLSTRQKTLRKQTKSLQRRERRECVLTLMTTCRRL
jgi:hypothetical protein